MICKHVACQQESFLIKKHNNFKALVKKKIYNMGKGEECTKITTKKSFKSLNI